jgi:hypothetical protein
MFKPESLIGVSFVDDLTIVEPAQQRHQLAGGLCVGLDELPDGRSLVVELKAAEELLRGDAVAPVGS